MPTLLSDLEARRAYDRLAAANFRDHRCEAQSGPAQHAPSDAPPDTGLAERARMLVMRGYKPKDAVELVLQEMALEHSEHSSTMERARKEASEFLDKIRRGLI